MARSPAADAPARNSLGHFDAPRYLAVEPADPAAATSAEPADALRARVLVVRAVLGIVVAVGAGLLAGDDGATLALAWLVAAAWLPGVAVLDLLARRAHRPVAALDLLWDLALWAAVDVVLDRPVVSAAGYLLTVAHHAYVGSRRLAVAGGALAVATMVTVPVVAGHHRDGLGMAVQVVAAGLLVWLLAEASGRHATARAGLVRVVERADAILAGIADAVVVVSPTGRIRQWNHASERVFGHPAGAVVGRSCAEVLALAEGARPLRCAGTCELLARAGSDVELWRTGPQGQRQPLLASAAAVLDEAGTPVEVIHSFRDITTVKAADEAKTMFLATASHELKTPLTVIRGSAQLLHRDDVDPADRAAMLDAIDARAAQLAGIVDRLLMSSRIEAGHIDLHLGPVALAPLVAERCEALGAVIGRPVACRSPEVSVDADRDAVTTVVDHLLDNAVKYSPGSGAITVEVGEAGDQVHLAVTDEGVGMTPDQVARCFDRFWQAEATDVRRFGGTGIGLYIVRSLVEAMGGSVQVASRPGEGTTFVVTLWRAGSSPEPLAPADGHDGGQPQAEGQHSMIREYMRQVGLPLGGGPDEGRRR